MRGRNKIEFITQLMALYTAEVAEAPKAKAGEAEAQVSLAAAPDAEEMVKGAEEVQSGGSDVEEEERAGKRQKK